MKCRVPSSMSKESRITDESLSSNSVPSEISLSHDMIQGSGVEDISSKKNFVHFQRGRTCFMRCDEFVVPVPNVALPQGTSMLPGDENPISRISPKQKLCVSARGVSLHGLTEQTPEERYLMLESRETTEGSDEQNICRICHTVGDEQLIAPCKCAGSAKFVHATCLLTWFKKSVKNQCELCQQQVSIKKKNKPVSKWKKPEDRPIPLIWFLVFFIGLFLNILSIYVNASEHCKSTACLIFYVVNGFGIVLDAAFLYFWWLKCLFYWKKWFALNQDWSIIDRSGSRGSGQAQKYLASDNSEVERLNASQVV